MHGYRTAAAVSAGRLRKVEEELGAYYSPLLLYERNRETDLYIVKTKKYHYYLN
jgi:hypothetical protein